ncbi:MAG TPA: EAL domain-containing protein, partial [Castellaniella sp.]|uniref:putative bifunctional diguanylate cyclase/phosphodiesterase n=1 Tax=Castellaniella sp. TaxID=1955812 RepID=UPI002F0B3EE5
MTDEVGTKKTEATLESPFELRGALSRQLRPLAYALAAMLGMILVITWGALRVQVNVAGFLNAESVWSKAQKQAVIELNHYALSGAASDYAGYERNVAVLDADRWIRDAVKRPHYDRSKVEAAFDRGHVMPSARTAMIFSMRNLTHAPYMDQALAAWIATDKPLDQLAEIATELHAAYASGQVTPQLAASARSRINALNALISPYTDTFSLQIARGAAWVARILFGSVLGAALIAGLLWLWMARRAFADIRDSQERYHTLFESAPDAMLILEDVNDHILAANGTAKAWWGDDPQLLVGKTYRQWSEQCVLQEVAPGDCLLLPRESRIRPVETQTSRVKWGREVIVRQALVRDVSDRVEHERTNRIAAEALASIKEGVLLIDANQRVISANAAACSITGFNSPDLVGAPFGDSRTFPDGSPLSATMWSVAVSRGHWTGEVRNIRRNGMEYTERLTVTTIRNAEHEVIYFVAVFSDITDAKKAHARLEHLAIHDPLTKLVNRAEFQRRCDAAITRAAYEHRAVTILFVDLDAFKFVNDSYSHAIGDQLLKLVSSRICNQLRADDVAGRIGGDEFTILLPDMATREDAQQFTERLLSTLSEPFQLGEHKIVVSASIGIAGFPLDGDNAETLIAHADLAMYVAKKEERNTCRFYTPAMQAEARQQVSLVTRLRQAMQNGEFRMVYQPIVGTNDQRIVGAEALLRWHHPDRGEIMPAEFIPVAERIGLARHIDQWVLQTVCAQLHAWEQAGAPHIRMDVNISAGWFSHPAFAQSVKDALDANHVSPDRLVLEITEGTILLLNEETTHTLQTLAEMGVRVAIDDFGTGYASMSYLKLPAIAFLKMDRSFISGLPGDADDAAIAKAILAMAETLKLTTIAEGVETDAQHRFLLEAHCAEAQGFLYSYPLPPAAFEHRLKSETETPIGRARLKLVPSQP